VHLARATQDMQNVTYLSTPLIVKMATTIHDRKSLKREYAVYQRFHAKDANVVKTHGLFSSTVRGDENRTFLLLEHGGTTLTDRNTSPVKLNGHLKRNWYGYSIHWHHRTPSYILNTCHLSVMTTSLHSHRFTP